MWISGWRAQINQNQAACEVGVQRPQFDVSSDRAFRRQGFHRTVMGTKSGKGAWSVGHRSIEQQRGTEARVSLILV